jgi:hypothetical protein
VTITVPQMPLSEIDGMVNLISARKAKERSNFRCVLATLLSAVQNFRRKSNFCAGRSPRLFGAHQHYKMEPEKWTKEIQILMAPLEWRRNKNFEGSKSYRKISYEALWTGSSGLNPAPPHASPRLNGGGRRPGLMQLRGKRPCITPS